MATGLEMSLGIGTLIKLINYCTWVFNYNNRNFVNGQYMCGLVQW